MNITSIGGLIFIYPNAKCSYSHDYKPYSHDYKARIYKAYGHVYKACIYGKTSYIYEFILYIRKHVLSILKVLLYT